MLGWRMERITPRPSSLQAAEAGISQSCPPHLLQTWGGRDVPGTSWT